MKYFIVGLGLITKLDITTENNNLFYAEYVVLSQIKQNQIDREFFIKDMASKNLSVGLYERRAGDSDTNKRTVSKDEISGWMVSSYQLKTLHGFFIWKKIVKSFGGYDAHNNRKSPFNPGEFYLWGELSGSFFSKLFFPFCLINLLIAMTKPAENTSGKLIYFIELFTLKDSNFVNKNLWNMFKWKMNKQYGPYWVEKLFDIYHGANGPDYPLIELSRNIKLE